MKIEFILLSTHNISYIIGDVKEILSVFGHCEIHFDDEGSSIPYEDAINKGMYNNAYGFVTFSSTVGMVTLRWSYSPNATWQSISGDFDVNRDKLTLLAAMLSRLCIAAQAYYAYACKDEPDKLYESVGRERWINVIDRLYDVFWFNFMSDKLYQHMSIELKGVSHLFRRSGHGWALHIDDLLDDAAVRKRWDIWCKEAGCFRKHTLWARFKRGRLLPDFQQEK
jgi:hypothetical protein